MRDDAANGMIPSHLRRRWDCPTHRRMCREAADHIDRLTARVRELEGALRQYRSFGNEDDVLVGGVIIPAARSGSDGGE